MNFCSVGYRNDGGAAHPMPTVVLDEEHVGIRIPGSRAGAKASAATTAEQHREAVLGLAGASGSVGCAQRAHRTSSDDLREGEVLLAERDGGAFDLAIVIDDMHATVEVGVCVN